MGFELICGSATRHGLSGGGKMCSCGGRPPRRYIYRVVYSKPAHKVRHCPGRQKVSFGTDSVLMYGGTCAGGYCNS